MTGQAVFGRQNKYSVTLYGKLYDIENDVKKAEAGPLMSAHGRKEYKSIHHFAES